MQCISTDDLALGSIPTEEDSRYEFKSSQTPLKELAKKLNCAASAFANSGGGYFLGGLSGDGSADGGVSQSIGSQDILDWVDQAIASVEPAVRYERTLLRDTEGRGTVNADCGVLAVAFPTSSSAPHMARDNKYYIRAGAHTLPASAFIVESLFARRAAQRPHLVHAVRTKPGFHTAVQVGAVALNNVPALDVEVSFESYGKTIARFANSLPLKIPVIDASTPFYMDCATYNDVNDDLPRDCVVSIRYRDLAGNSYEHRSDTPLVDALPPLNVGRDPLPMIASELEKIRKKKS